MYIRKHLDIFIIPLAVSQGFIRQKITQISVTEIEIKFTMILSRWMQMSFIWQKMGCNDFVLTQKISLKFTAFYIKLNLSVS